MNYAKECVLERDEKEYFVTVNYLIEYGENESLNSPGTNDYFSIDSVIFHEFNINKILTEKEIDSILEQICD